MSPTRRRRSSAEERTEVEVFLRLYEDHKQYLRELVPVTTRLPRALHLELKRRALASTLQLLVEHAYWSYMGSRVTPSDLGPRTWPEPARGSKLAALSAGPLTSFTVRLPRHLLLAARHWGVDANLSEQELAMRVFEWYVGVDLVPAFKGKEVRDEEGRLVSDEKLAGYLLEARDQNTMELNYEFWEHRTKAAKAGWTWKDERRELYSPSFWPVDKSAQEDPESDEDSGLPVAGASEGTPSTPHPDHAKTANKTRVR